MAGSDLEQRITQLQDIEAIKRLKALYCDICDDNHNPDRIVKIFAEDGIWEGGDFGAAQGHDAIRKLFEGFAKLIIFAAQCLQSADRGRWQPRERHLVFPRAVHVSPG